jgi:drug/metabolite transporter (DMT)-like permease
MSGPELPSAPKRLVDWDPEEPRAVEKRGLRMLLGLILMSVVLAAVAHLTLKHGMTQVTDHQRIPLDLKDPLATVRRIASNISVWGGLALFVLSAAVWIIVLSRASLSYAYPFVSLTYALILLFDRFVLGEAVPSVRWLGVVLIIAGIVLVSRTGAVGGA